MQGSAGVEAATNTGQSLTAFFALVFGMSVPFWALGATTGAQLAPGLPISSLVVVSPVTAAAVLVYRERGKAGVIGLLKRSFDFRRIRSLGWYAPTLLLMPATTVLAYAAMRVVGLPVPPFQIPVVTSTMMLAVYFVAAQGEELGWSGFATDRMQLRWTALQTALVLGLVWATWHIVLLAQGHRGPEWVAWQFLFLVAQRIVIVWLYNGTGRSVFAAALFHATSNVSTLMFPDYYDPRVAALVMGLAAAVVTAFWGPATLARFETSPIVRLRRLPKEG